MSTLSLFWSYIEYLDKYFGTRINEIFPGSPLYTEVGKYLLMRDNLDHEIKYKLLRLMQMADAEMGMDCDS